MSDENVFKTCPGCQTSWKDAQELVEDLSLQVNGYQAAFDHPENGLFFLTHLKDDCHSTIAIKVSEFRTFYNGPTLKVRNTGNHTCMGNCLMQNNLEGCTADCDMQWIRDVLQYLRRHEIPSHLK